MRSDKLSAGSAPMRSKLFSRSFLQEEHLAREEKDHMAILAHLYRRYSFSSLPTLGSQVGSKEAHDSNLQELGHVTQPLTWV